MWWFSWKVAFKVWKCWTPTIESLTCNMVIKVSFHILKWVFGWKEWEDEWVEGKGPRDSGICAWVSPFGNVLNFKGQRKHTEIPGPKRGRFLGLHLKNGRDLMDSNLDCKELNYMFCKKVLQFCDVTRLVIIHKPIWLVERYEGKNIWTSLYVTGYPKGLSPTTYPQSRTPWLQCLTLSNFTLILETIG